MRPLDRVRDTRVTLSVIVPFHRNTDHLSRALTALSHAATQLPARCEVVEILVASDGAVDDPAPAAAQAGATVLHFEGPLGPAAVRTRAAAVATGTVLVFVDADVVVRPDALERLAALFAADSDVGAAFGAYDINPADPGFVSQCRNLSHSFVHQRADRDAHTFWAGLGAVRADVFAAVDGFDQRFVRPCVEDIDLGYRIRAAGHRIVIDPAITGTHLKRWTISSSIVSDIRDRGIPWTQLLKRYGSMRNDLNISVAYRASVVLAYVLAASLAGMFRWPAVAVATAASIVLLWGLNWPYYRFFVRERGLLFTLRWFPLHILHHFCNGISYATGTALVLFQRWTGVALPGALPLTPWPVRPAPNTSTNASVVST